MDEKSIVIKFRDKWFRNRYQRIQNKYNIFSFSNLWNHPEINDETNKKTLIKILIETPKPLDIKESAAKRAKAYNFTYDNEEYIKIENDYKDKNNNHKLQWR